MLVLETIARIRQDHLDRGVPIKKIARDLKASRNTVRKVARQAALVPPMDYYLDNLHRAKEGPMFNAD